MAYYVYSYVARSGAALYKAICDRKQSVDRAPIAELRLGRVTLLHLIEEGIIDEK